MGLNRIYKIMGHRLNFVNLSKILSVWLLVLICFTSCSWGRDNPKSPRTYLNNSSHCKSLSQGSLILGDESIALNPDFDNGLSNWAGKGCQIILHDSLSDGKIVPQSGKYFISTTGRADSGSGIQQELTGRAKRKLAYELTAVVRIYGGNVPEANIQATLWIQTADFRQQFIFIASVNATDSDWVQMQGKFLINGFPSKVLIFLEGPPPGTDILLNSLVVKHAAKMPPSPPPKFEVGDFWVNVVTNSNQNDGTTSDWFCLGSCTLSVGTGSPNQLPSLAAESLGLHHQPVSGGYILATNRAAPWMGPAQTVTGKIKLYMTYQVSAWVRIGPGAIRPQLVNVAVSIDGQWVNGGSIEIGDDKTWHEVAGSFRIEKQPTNVMVYVQGPDAGIDLMLAGMQIFAVDRSARFQSLKKQTNMVRKRDVILRLTGTDSSNGTKIRVKQTRNSFPIGSCLSRNNIDNEDFVNFFVRHFTWSVFENELKWFYTEPQQGNLNYKDADDLLNFCTSHNIKVRGHSIFWEDPNAVQPWVRALNGNDLISAVQNRVTGLVTRYKGKFKHYDVDNEILHSSFYKDRLGNSIRAYMFNTTRQLDPLPTLFLNDFHIEDGNDFRSSPEKYTQLILDLKQQGAPVGGIGIQGHIDSPVGPIVRSALDKLGILRLPIWFTELDVSSTNEYTRADDLEVMLREAFAHPAVDGIVLWGFWELLMNRQNAFLVNAEGDLTEAGRRFLALKQEWLSHAHGFIDNEGQFSFRGYHGSYKLEIFGPNGNITRSFNVGRGKGPLLIPIHV
ncbi:OLC1v1017081C1 [Oldenlandia corymbosa var. corymbosa]|uniref:OLC1v1017081C1 n=1 Tax=Oldenlandia corymbosa var. corymbosa TaxID=529605 RepID=A0AAV1E8M5_OLDCO|nr:OLC1v1017081C1 [Oldenlandia corymbosa var. corymbosa]